MEKKFKSVVIIGRIVGDDEDTCSIFNDVTLSEARVNFANELFSEYGAEADTIRDQHVSNYGGLGILITHILYSDGMIEYA